MSEESDNVEVTIGRSRPVDQVVQTGIDPDNFRIYLGSIEEDTGAWFRTALDHLNSELTDTPIEVVLNTPGGDVVSMLAVHDAIRSSRRPIRVLATGQVCSAGVLILACGHDRVVTPSCCLMSHEPTVGTGEIGLRAAKKRVKYEEWNQRWWCQLMARYTPNDAAWWQRTTERQAEHWLLGGAEIVEAGLADRVEEERR